MTPNEFRQAGYEAIDWIAEWLADPRKYPVTPSMEPGELVDALPASAPEKGDAGSGLMEDFRELIVPACVHWNHPRFLAYFSNTAPAEGILGELLAAALNMNGMLWSSSPAVTELEEVAMSWLRQWLGLPEQFFGIIYDTASISSFHAIVAAREAADPEARQRGGRGDLAVYTSEQSHSSIEKAAIAAGLGQDNVRKIGVDDAFRMRADLLEEAVRADIAGGKKPCCVVATAGTTSTTSVDPIAAIAAIAERYGLWFHVDAAYAGPAAMLAEYGDCFAGLDRADSVVTNPHKWLFTPCDLSAFFTRKPEVLRQAFSLVPEYLRTDDAPRARNLMNYGIQLGRRFRALKLWFVLRSLGREGVSALLRGQIRMAAELAARVEAHPRFELAAPAPFSVVCLRYKGTDEQNRRLLEMVNRTHEAYLSHTVLRGRYVIRIAIGNMATSAEDINHAWELLQKTAANL
ncbi:MAG: aminotransferase class V-fold PLP-dependent enzyme [Bryobacterales bacterium]|nr:aminotransferase class V-fold PLP-dependent enzyme [Bryobacterales bacterium]